MNPIFQRTELLIGRENLEKINNAKVIIFGVGGVGSWCAESLVRTGIENLTIVDSDRVCVTNVNRQVQATSANIGCSKTDELKKRLLEINPRARVTPLEMIYDYKSRDQFNLNEFDYVIDAIDSLSCKVELILHAGESDCTFFSAMGAACRLDPLKIKVDSIWNTDTDGLSRVVRKKLRKKKYTGDFICVYSDEVLPNLGASSTNETGDGPCPEKEPEKSRSKQQINGTVAHMTAIYGFILSSLVIQDLVRGKKTDPG